MKINWNSGWGEGGCKTKNLLWGEYGYFLELHNRSQKGDATVEIIPATFSCSFVVLTR